MHEHTFTDRLFQAGIRQLQATRDAQRILNEARFRLATEVWPAGTLRGLKLARHARAASMLTRAAAHLARF